MPESNLEIKVFNLAQQSSSLKLSPQLVLSHNLLSQDNRQKLVEGDVLDLGGDSATSFQEQSCVAPVIVELSELLGNAIVLLEEDDVEGTDGAGLVASCASLDVDLATRKNSERLEFLLGSAIQPRTVNESRSRVHLLAVLELAVLVFARRHRPHVLFAVFAVANVALNQILGDARFVIATLVLRLRRDDLEEVEGQQLTPCWEHRGDVWMLRLFVDGLLKPLDDVIGRWESV